MHHEKTSFFSPGSRVPFGYYLGLIFAWCGAWLLHETSPFAELSSEAQLAYWTVAKLMIWIAPILVLVRYVLRQPLIGYLGLTRMARGVRIGFAIGVVFVALSACIDVFARAYRWPSPSLALLSALTIAPLFEEVMFRGFILRGLEDASFRFWSANAIAALMFLGLHLPGWYFMNALGSPQIIVAASIFLIGLVAGYAKQRSGSTWASITFHFVNNLYAAFLH